MSKTESGAKKAGKVLTAFVILILIAVFAASGFIGGQDTAAEKYCAAVATANFKDYVKIVSADDPYAGSSEDEFKAACKNGLRNREEFAELDEIDNISSKVKITERRMNGSYTDWICKADIDFFSSGHSNSFKGVSVEMTFSGGKWIISDIEPDVF